MIIIAGNNKPAGNRRQIIIFLGIFVLSGLLGCRTQSEPVSTPTPTATPSTLVINLQAVIDAPTARPSDTPAPTATRPPTETPIPTETSLPPTPTPEPPTATPTPPEIPLDVQLYGEEVGRIMANFTGEMNLVSDLLGVNRTDTVEWVGRLRGKIVSIRLIHAELREVIPPLEMTEIHEALFSATDTCKAGVELLGDDLDDNTLDDLAPIAEKIALCDEQLASIITLERAYLARLSAGETGSPTATPETAIAP